jgi:HSP20 family protein
MAEPTKLPVKKETVQAVVPRRLWSPFESLRREMDQAFENFGLRSWPVPVSPPMF